VTFTSKAEFYLLERLKKDKANDVQKVKFADTELVEVNNIRTNKAGNKAVVNYATAFKHVTPFATIKVDDFFNKTKTNKACFAFGDEGWKLENKPDITLWSLKNH
jgi:hypothetical protein